VTPALPASPPDISAILTSLGVFSLAIAAVVGGIYKGIKEVKKGGADTGTEVKSALLMETVTARSLSDSNLQLVAVNKEITDLLRSLDHRAAQLIEALQDHRAITRSQIEEQHRLRAATVDLLEIMRRRP
jgi:predicted RecB family endonuclease